ncbi:MAG TPA: hypothetical protein VHG08_00615 [Longimicrobium sp.]|nr:hypothetical protein [Longimicrobium sp.]
MPKRSRTPQEKKELSYAKDGRNTYGESRRQSIKAIARRKSKANRAFRRAETQALAAVPEADADVFVARAGRRSWQKIPDAPLGEYVAMRLESREAEGMNATGKQSGTLAAGRKRARVRTFCVMGGLFRGQNRAAARLHTADAVDHQDSDDRPVRP